MQTLIVRKKGSTVAVVAVAVVFGRARGYVRTYVVFLHTYPSRPVHGVCRLWAGSGPVFFFRTYVRTAPRGQVLLARECQRGRVLSFARETGRARAETFARAQRPSDGGT